MAIPHSVIPAQAGTHAMSESAMRPMFHSGEKTPCVYFITNQRDGVLYTGVTSDLFSRIREHVDESFEGFSKRYGLKRLVYYEMHPTMLAAITREKRIKDWKRAWKIRLINGFNPEWLDLYDYRSGDILPGPADIERLREHG